MNIIPVLDIRHGQAVHARGGNRDHYAPVVSVLHEGADPLGLALAFRDRIGLCDLYVADLDAILGEQPHRELLQAIARLGMTLLLDAGLRSSREIEPWMRDHDVHLVAGLETVADPDQLAQIVDRHGPDRVVFSLDLRDGRPLVPTSRSWGTTSPRELARMAVGRGIRRLIVLDLARVGGGQGVGTHDLLRQIQDDHPAVQRIAGGGVAGAGDLRDLEAAGASAALVGSALHDGRITSATIRRAAR